LATEVKGLSSSEQEVVRGSFQRAMWGAFAGFFIAQILRLPSKLVGGSLPGPEAEFGAVVISVFLFIVVGAGIKVATAKLSELWRLGLEAVALGSCGMPIAFLLMMSYFTPLAKSPILVSAALLLGGFLPALITAALKIVFEGLSQAP
jgi:hypothetical protein